jgi:hypothetical protein
MLSGSGPFSENTLERMKDQLIISGNLDHDGDGLVRFRITAENPAFRGTTLTWGNEERISELLSALAGFPKTSSDRVEFVFGTPRTGVCRLEFQTVDSLGHCCVWVDLEAPYASTGKDRFEHSLVCVKFVPASLDEFCNHLRRFKRGRQNEAVLAKHAL